MWDDALTLKASNAHLDKLDKISQTICLLADPKLRVKSREDIALQIFCAVVANDGLQSDRLSYDVESSFEAADLFIKQRGRV